MIGGRASRPSPERLPQDLRRAQPRCCQRPPVKPIAQVPLVVEVGQQACLQIGRCHGARGPLPNPHTTRSAPPLPEAVPAAKGEAMPSAPAAKAKPAAHAQVRPERAPGHADPAERAAPGSPSPWSALAHATAVPRTRTCDRRLGKTHHEGLAERRTRRTARANHRALRAARPSRRSAYRTPARWRSARRRRDRCGSRRERNATYRWCGPEYPPEVLAPGPSASRASRLAARPSRQPLHGATQAQPTTHAWHHASSVDR